MLQSLTTRARASPNWRPLAWAAGALALFLLAAWAVPPMLDWGRFRTAIAAIAAARLGRPVVIGGEISLRLVPQAVLTASDVTLADQGDGISVQVPALRLQVATLPLLTGRIALRDIVLSAPVLRVPWSLPGGIGRSNRPQVPHPFAARIENGTLLVGQAEITGISAAIHGGPAPGAEAASADAAPVAAFGAEGFATAGGHGWRFTGALGAPDADGISAVDLTVRGQGAVADTRGAIQGTLADGTMQGRLRASGANLSLLMPASSAPWTVEAPFVADADQIEANAINLSLGGAPADGALTLHLDRPARLDGHLHAAALDLNGWAALLGRTLQPGQAAAATLPMRIALSADTARLLSGEITGVRATVISDGTGLGFDHPEASLPGGARLAADAALLHADPAHPGGPLALTGMATLSAPDLHATLAWLRPLAPDLADLLPDGVLHQADLSGRLSLQAGAASAAGLTGHIDGSAVSGSIAMGLAGHPSLQADLLLDRLAIDPWLRGVAGIDSLAVLGRRVRSLSATVHITARQASWHGESLHDVTLDALAGPGGLVLQRAAASMPDATASLAGSVGIDGRLTGMRLQASAPALEKLLPRLPAAFRWAPGLWRGPGTLQATADGPPGALALQLRADAGDVVVEADSVRDTIVGTGATTITARHPGAPWLLAALGLPQALGLSQAGGLPAGVEHLAAWLDTGALTFRAHLTDWPGHLAVQDFDLDAAALRLAGHLAADWTGSTPALTGTLAFEQLALPAALPAIQPVADALGSWNTQFHVSAETVTIGLRPVATKASVSLAGGRPGLQASDLAAAIAGGRLAGKAWVAGKQAGARLTLTGATLDHPLTGWPIDLVSGTADLAVALDDAGTGWSGTAHADLRGATVAGFDLGQLSSLSPPHGKAARAAVQRTLSEGQTDGLSGTADATLSHDRVTLQAARALSPAGSFTLQGSADLAATTVDLHAVLSPARQASAAYGLRLSGGWTRPAAVPDKPGSAR